MHLREVFATHLIAADRALRLRFTTGLNEVEAPAAQIPALLTCIQSLFFPTDPEVDLGSLARERGLECGLVFAASDRNVRIRRGVDDDSVRLQLLDERGRFVTVETGGQAVSAALATSLGLSDAAFFDVANLGRYGRLAEEGFGDSLTGDLLDDTVQEFLASGLSDEEDEVSGILGLPAPSPSLVSEAEVARLRSEYARAREVEQLEESLASLHHQLGQLREQMRQLKGDDSELETIRHELSTVLDPDQLPPEDRDMLEGADDRLHQLELRRSLLNKRLERLARMPARPEMPWQNPLILGGLGTALLITLVVLFSGPAIRPLALANVACLGLALTGALQLLRVREDAKLRAPRQEELTQAMANLDSEQRKFTMALHDIRHAWGVQSAEDLQRARERRAELLSREQSVRAARRDVYDDPRYTALSSQRLNLEERIFAVEERLEELGEVYESSFELAQHMEQLGVALEEDEEKPTGEVIEAAAERMNPFSGLRQLAEWLGLYRKRQLDGVTARLWANMAHQVSGDNSDRPIVDDSGSRLLEHGESSLAYLSTSSRLIAVETFTLALLLRSIDRMKPGPPPIVIRGDPFRHLTEAQRGGLRTLYTHIGAHLQVILLTPSANPSPPA